MTRRHKFWILTLPERVLLFQSLLVLPLTRLGLKVLGFQRWQNALNHIPHKRSSSAAGISLSTNPPVSSRELDIQRARQIARLVRAAANHGLYRANCLDQSLVLCWLLRRHGLESKIRFGARKEKNQLQAHAWVECLGIALNEDQGLEQRYAPFAGVTPGTPLESR